MATRRRRHTGEQTGIVMESSSSVRRRPDPVDCGIRLLLDPYLCIGPGSEAHANVLFGLSQGCAALGITLCVERQAWLEASRDPDVVRRRIDLSRFEPLVKLDALPLPDERDAQSLFLPRSETDVADLKLLGALHSGTAHHLVALDGRIHALAARAGFQSRVLTPADALDWLDTLAGGGRGLLLRELDPRAVSAPGMLHELVRDECEPYDPYLRRRLESGRGRVLATFADEEPLALGVLESGKAAGGIDLVALAARETARGARALEPILSTALGMARRRGVPLTALLPPHDEMILQLLQDLEFRREGRDPHGRECLVHAAEPLAPGLAAGNAAWIVPVDADEHDRLLPEMSGSAQAQLFAVGADSRPQTLGSPVRKQVMLPAGGRAPLPGDLLLFFHGRAAHRAASASLTCVARVESAHPCARLDEVLALGASRPAHSLAEITSRLSEGATLVVNALMLGRLQRFIALSRLKDLGMATAMPRRPEPLDPGAWERLRGNLALA